MSQVHPEAHPTTLRRDKQPLRLTTFAVQKSKDALDNADLIEEIGRSMRPVFEWIGERVRSPMIRGRYVLTGARSWKTSPTNMRECRL